MPQWTDDLTLLPLQDSATSENMLPWESDLGYTDRLWKTVSKLQQNVSEGLVGRKGLRPFSDSLSGRHHYEQ